MSSRLWIHLTSCKLIGHGFGVIDDVHLLGGHSNLEQTTLLVVLLFVKTWSECATTKGDLITVTVILQS